MATGERARQEIGGKALQVKVAGNVYERSAAGEWTHKGSVLRDPQQIAMLNAEASKQAAKEEAAALKARKQQAEQQIQALADGNPVIKMVLEHGGVKMPDGNKKSWPDEYQAIPERFRGKKGEGLPLDQLADQAAALKGVTADYFTSEFRAELEAFETKAERILADVQRAETGEQQSEEQRLIMQLENKLITREEFDRAMADLIGARFSVDDSVWRYDEADPVVLTGSEIGEGWVDYKAARKWAEENGQTGTFKNIETGWEIIVTGNRIKGALSKGAARDKVKLVAGLKPIIERAVFLESQQSSDDPNIAHFFAAPATVAGKEYAVGFLIKEDKQTHKRFYDHEMTEELSLKEAVSERGQNASASPGSVVKVLQKHLGVNPTEALRFSVSSVKPWPADFPDADVHTTRAHIMGQHEALFKQAKAGDDAAAWQLVSSVAKPTKIQELSRKFAGAIVVPVHAEEATGRNAIPVAFAEFFARHGDFTVEDGIVQSVRAEHTGKGAFDRILRRPDFHGDVKQGQAYIIVDDHITQGGTVSELRHYIENNGGRVVQIAALTASMGSATVAIQKETIEALREKFGEQFEEQLKRSGIAGSAAALTESEGRYLLKFSPESFRTRVVASGSQEARFRDGSAVRPHQIELFSVALTQEHLDRIVPVGEESDHEVSYEQINPRFAVEQQELFQIPAGDGGAAAQGDEVRNAGEVPALKGKTASYYKIGLEQLRTVALDKPTLKIENPADAAALLYRITSPVQERMIMIPLDDDMRLMESGPVILTMGTVSSSLVDTKQIVQAVKATGASKIIMAHNHPSGKPDPSPNDIEITKKTLRVLESVGLKGSLVDHVIVGRDQFYSMVDAGVVRFGSHEDGSQKSARSGLKRSVKTIRLNMLGVVAGDYGGDQVTARIKINNYGDLGVYLKQVFNIGDQKKGLCVIGADVKMNVVAAHIVPVDEYDIKTALREVMEVSGVENLFAGFNDSSFKKEQAQQLIDEAKGVGIKPLDVYRLNESGGFSMRDMDLLRFSVE